MGILYKAVFASAYYGLLRVSEVTTGAHPILAKHVQIGLNKNKILFVLGSSKTHDKPMKPQLVKISVRNGKGITQARAEYCPFTILHAYINNRPKRSQVAEAFFVFVDGTPVRPHHMRRILKLMLLLAGFDSKLYDMHSLRIRHCVDLLEATVSVETIKELVRWRSNCVFTYLSHA